MSNSIKVCIFDDNKHLRESLQLLLNGTSGYNCVGAFPDCRNIVANLKAIQCDIALMDIEMPGMNGIEATKIIREQLPHIHILIQTVFSDDDKIFRAICAGASGYILKSTTPFQYIEALNDVHSGGSPMTPGIARRVFELFKNNVHLPSPDAYYLTEKEKLVLRQLTKGKSYKMMADELQLSVETIKTHMKNIYTKLHVHSGPEAVAKAIKEKIA